MQKSGFMFGRVWYVIYPPNGDWFGIVKKINFTKPIIPAFDDDRCDDDYYFEGKLVTGWMPSIAFQYAKEARKFFSRMPAGSTMIKMIVRDGCDRNKRVFVNG